jgi:hypothetical protein
MGPSQSSFPREHPRTRVNMHGWYVLYMIFRIVQVCLEIKLDILEFGMFRGRTVWAPGNQGSGVILELYKLLGEYRAWMHRCVV